MSGTGRRAGSPPTGDTARALGVGDVSTPAEFLALLDALRKTKNLSFNAIGKRAGRGMGRSTAHTLLTGDVLPTLRQLELLLKACRVPAEETRQWVNSWHRVDRLTRAAEEPAATPPGAPGAPGDDLPVVARPVEPPTPPPAPPPPVDRAAVGGPPTARRPRLGFAARALAALVVLVAVLTGSAIAMWVAHVPIEVILTVYGVMTVCVTSWAVVARHHPVPARERRTPYREDPGIFEDPVQWVAAPVIGDRY